MGLDEPPTSAVNEVPPTESSQRSSKVSCPIEVPGSEPPEILEFSAPTQQTQPKTWRWPKLSHSAWWWWEIGACAIGIASMLILVGLLKTIDNQPVREWTHARKPSVYISACITVARTAIMISVASCISQLKWRHYQLGSSRLHHLQVFDNASRGPVGSAAALLNFSMKPSLIMALAAVTLISLAMGPIAQEISDFQEMEVPLRRSKGEIAVAQDYYSTSIDEFGNVRPTALFVRSTLLKAFNNEVFQPNSNCRNSTTVCKWEKPVTTLGVCRDTQILTDTLERKTTTEQLPFNDTTKFLSQTRYSFEVPRLTAPVNSSKNVGKQPNLPGLALDVVIPRRNNDNSTGGVIHAKTLLNTTARVELPDPNSNGYHEGVSFAFIRTPINRPLLEDADFEPKIEIWITRWHFCIMTYHNVIVNTGGVFFDKSDRQPLFYVASSENASTAVRGYTIYRDESGSQQYNISFGRSGTMWHTLASLLDSKNLLFKQDYNNSHPMIVGPDDNDDGDFGRFLHERHGEPLLEDITNAAGNLIRSGWDMNGENKESYMVGVLADGNELYYQVKWPWVALPIGEVAAVAFLLALTIWKNRGQPLLKDSVAAYLLYGLQGWSETELDTLLPNGDESGPALRKVAKGMKARLARDDHGRWRFKREVPGPNRRATLRMLYSPHPAIIEEDNGSVEDLPRTRSLVRD